MFKFFKKIKVSFHTSVDSPYGVGPLVFIMGAFALLISGVFVFQPDSLSPTVTDILYSNFKPQVWAALWLVSVLTGLWFFLTHNYLAFFVFNVSFVFNSFNFGTVLAVEKFFNGARISLIGVTQWYVLSAICLLMVLQNWPLKKIEG